MNVLVIGGTYFVGRVFVMMASKRGDIDLTLLNRGKYSMNMEGVREIHCDRHDTAAVTNALHDSCWDAVVDFCAYEPGDINGIMGIQGFSVKQYLMISTSSVCDVPGVGIKTETSPVISSPDGTRDGDYAYKKALLEEELKNCCATTGAAYTIFRPAYVFGPYNYVERESWFIRMIAEGRAVPYPAEADAHFRFVYVGDIANAILLCLSDERSKNEIYNLAAPEMMDYRRFFEVLREVSGCPFETIEVTNKRIVEGNIPLPYPIIKDDICDGSKIEKELGFVYQPFESCMKKTWNAFIKVYNLNPKWS